MKLKNSTSILYVEFLSLITIYIKRNIFNVKNISKADIWKVLKNIGIIEKMNRFAPQSRNEYQRNRKLPGCSMLVSLLERELFLNQTFHDLSNWYCLTTAR